MTQNGLSSASLEVGRKKETMTTKTIMEMIIYINNQDWGTVFTYFDILNRK